MSKTMWVIVAVLALAMSSCSARKMILAKEDNVAVFEKDLLNATAMLVSFSKNGDMTTCTAVVFERDGKKYYLLTAAHCVLKEEKPVEGIWFMLFGDAKNNNIVFAKFLVADAKYGGDGFAVFEAKLADDSIPVIPIATRDALLGEEVSSVSFPHAFPKQLFRGYVSRENQDFDFFGRNYKDFVFLQFYAAPGSSGAAVVSRKERAIVAIVQRVNGQNGGTAVVGLAISNFRKFWTEFKNESKQKAN